MVRENPNSCGCVLRCGILSFEQSKACRSSTNVQFSAQTTNGHTIPNSVVFSYDVHELQAQTAFLYNRVGILLNWLKYRQIVKNKPISITNLATIMQNSWQIKRY